MSKHFKMYVKIKDIICEKRIDLAYPIQGKEVAVISMFSDNIQYWIRKTLKVILSNEEVRLPEGVFMDRELNLSVGRKVITLLGIEYHQDEQVGRHYRDGY